MEYYRFSANGTSMFYMQEYFAAKVLREMGIVPDDAIFIPGHTGDFLAGSQLTKLNIREHISIKKITGRILNFRYNLNPMPPESQRRYKQQVHAQIMEIQLQHPEASTYSIFENWDQKERLSKLIGNSANVYNYFGFEHRLPFYDLEMLVFFRDLPYPFKQNKRLYSRVLRENYFVPFGIDFQSTGLQPGSARIQWQWLKENIKHCLPEKLKTLFYQRSDPYFYGPITDVMVGDMEKKGITLNTAVRHRNGVIVQWYLNQLMIEEPCV
jgi:asparagine synthase (glutamine-hydrolysing)